MAGSVEKGRLRNAQRSRWGGKVPGLEGETQCDSQRVGTQSAHAGRGQEHKPTPTPTIGGLAQKV